MQDRLCGYEPQVYQCTDCGALMDEQDIGVRPINAEGVKELYCTQCSSTVIRLA